MTAELDTLQRDLKRARIKLAIVETPGRFLLVHAAAFVALPCMFLMIAHFLVTFGFDISPIYLRIASVLISLPFGFVLGISKDIGFRGAMAFGLSVAALSISGMLAVTARLDDVNFLPSNGYEWREVLEYAASITLAFGAGNILATLLFRVLPRTFSSRGKPNAGAYWVASLLGQHVGKEALRRRARLVQDTLRTIGPLIGFLVTASGSVYAGLKGFLAN